MRQTHRPFRLPSKEEKDLTRLFPEKGNRMEWFYKFPHMDDDALRNLKKAIDEGFRAFTRAYGDTIESMFSPLQSFLLAADRFMTQTPWPIITAIILTIAWFASRSVKIVLSCLITLLLIGYFDMWTDTMRTVAMIFVCTVLSIAVGLPIGILMARSNGVQRVVNPILDVMQTMPSFVYLIPVVMLLGIGRVPGLIAVVIYAIPPMIRLTDLGIRLVDKDVLEAADAFGTSETQKLFKVQLPLALPTIMAGINQTIMMALAMVVVASMIGVQGLGQPVLKAIANQYFTLGVFNGLAIVGIAIIFDRVSQAYGKRLQKHREIVHG
ncbi:Histidine ABC transporter, permease protein (plasmid) [Neorhizobium galegae bv. officinalis bv. officinalis str. HAMBI 1141]|uniref:Histidine ABC transporter, permease protein n=2 Tax=Rhizobium/Agrobacterium group TaxID=227290 RepID=A0A068TIN6_NEOGA|nr:Histidine ABC transporter, permease protein [Neorhizobium galegae bv. officinalis bv. officinalis str. HAMBI 1141]